MAWFIVGKCIIPEFETLVVFDIELCASWLEERSNIVEFVDEPSCFC